MVYMICTDNRCQSPHPPLPIPFHHHPKNIFTKPTLVFLPYHTSENGPPDGSWPVTAVLLRSPSRTPLRVMIRARVLARVRSREHRHGRGVATPIVGAPDPYPSIYVTAYFTSVLHRTVGFRPPDFIVALLRWVIDSFVGGRVQYSTYNRTSRLHFVHQAQCVDVSSKTK